MGPPVFLESMLHRESLHAISMEIHLDFEHYLAIYNHLLTGDKDRDATWYHRAERLHVLRVNDALVDVMGSAVALGQSLGKQEGAHHLTQGLGRRLKFIWLSIRSLVAISPPDRTEPMTSDEVETVARDLNVIYINIRGALDNIAAALPSVFGYTGTVSPMGIDLFKHTYLTKIGADDINTILNEFRGWAVDLSKRRNPAAHRIPLSVPPRVITKDTRADYELAVQVASDAHAAARSAYRPGYYPEDEWAAVRAANEALERVGFYTPVFVHHPDDGSQPIYPLVASDIANLLKVTRLIGDHIRELMEAANNGRSSA